MVDESNAVHARAGKRCSFMGANLSRNQAVASHEKSEKNRRGDHENELSHDSSTLSVDSSILCCRSFAPRYQESL